MPQAAQTDRAAPGDRPFSGREANHSSAERRLDCGLAKIQF
ncbi:MAG: hypothetical protein SO173_09610 [Lachnospiraceae bacterium]|nr:hypothetical protein [Clostridium sp.]MDY4821892.1 hypothetical protein [Lachnospiraceae bacterium]